MSYTIYQNVKVTSIKTENVSRRLRPEEIADVTKRRSDYSVLVASISDVPGTVSIADFKTDLQVGQTVSVNNKQQLIALVNHTTGKEASLKYQVFDASEIFSTLFFLAIPGILFFSIGFKAYQTIKYHDISWVLWGIGCLIIFLVLRGINKEFSESKAALSSLTSLSN